MATPHAIHEEFPADAEVIHKLKVSDAHFARLLEEYDDVNDDVENAAANVTPMSDAAETDLRKKRAHLKDEIARAIAEAKKG
ncbi:MAG: YdcH family protein [Paracoccus sp. (in: a-proteobacteria)]|uniref:YdcH family protein n=1 Tax=Paracoccus sp. TaxID=267 RepID=UPI0026E07941|nr:YdcH family protein [Paracoccus sp. (in: a-proteobacteria)]MDO5621992.1 YdcH family protein [Paracoccus sp. (in: a-proteobacteria)]